MPNTENKEFLEIKEIPNYQILNIAYMSRQITVNTERRGDILMSRRQNSRIISSDEIGRDH